MDKRIVIDVDITKSSFVLSDCFDFLSKNKRLIMSLKRIGYTVEDNTIYIPFAEKSRIQTLEDIQRVLSKFKITKELSETTSNQVESYDREIKLFEVFEEKARSIRNDDFDKYSELVEDFESFKNTLDKELERTLYPLQLLSAFHMAFSQNSCNFAVPGAGKTSIVYGAYAFLRSLPEDDPRHVNRLLVIGPISSFAPWEREFKACFGFETTVQRLSGDSSISRDKKEEHLYSGDPREITLIYHGGVPSLQREIIDFLKSNRVMVVVDEAHRIKNPDGVWGRSAVEISKEACSRIVLTGTPVPNGYEDLFNLYQFIYPYKYKEILGFHYANLQDMTQRSSPDSARVKEFTDNISPFFIRIKKEDLNLPPIEEEVIYVEMNTRQREIYDYIESQYVDSFMDNPNGTVKDILNRAKLIRLRQAATNPALLSKPLKESIQYNPHEDEIDPNYQFTSYSDEFVDDSEFFNKICNYEQFETPQKYVVCKDFVEREIVSKGGKVIIWTIFIQNAKGLRDYLKEHSIDSRLLIGETEQSERERIIDIFNDPNNSDFSVVIANPFSVAESISLHKGCHNALYLERDYNCSNFLQSKDRIHRVGLEKNQITRYFYTVCKNSIDQIIDRRLLQKIERMEAIINHDIPLFTRLNDTDETDIIYDLIKQYAQRT